MLIGQRLGLNEEAAATRVAASLRDVTASGGELVRIIPAVLERTSRLIMKRGILVSQFHAGVQKKRNLT